MNQVKNLQPTSTKLYGLDHLRTLAILFVFLFHYGRLFPHPGWTNTISEFGWTGVDLFFVLSGYLIASQLFIAVSKTKKVPLKEFFIKRFFRILPPYLIVVLIYFCFPFVREREALAPVWKYLSFTQNLGLDLRTQGTFSHAWSLCIEEQFYLVLPLLLSVMLYFRVLKKSAWLILVLFIGGFIARYLSYQELVAPFTDDDYFGVYWMKWIYYPTYCRLDGLLTGVAIAALFHYKPLLKEKIVKYGNLVFLLSIGVLAAAYVLCHDQQSFAASVFGFPLVSIGYGLMVIAAISPTSFLYRTKSGITERIAIYSYSIYLLHKMTIHITQQQFSRLNVKEDSNLMFVLCIITALLAALLMHVLIEKPFLQWRNKILRK